MIISLNHADSEVRLCDKFVSRLKEDDVSDAEDIPGGKWPNPCAKKNKKRDLPSELDKDRREVRACIYNISHRTFQVFILHRVTKDHYS